MRDHESGHLAVLALVTAGTGDCEQEGWRGVEGHVRMRRQEERRRMRRMSSWTLSNRGSSADLTISLFLGNRIDLGPPCTLIAWQQIDEYITPRLLLVRTPPSSSHAEAVPSLELAHEHVGARRNAQHQHHWHACRGSATVPESASGQPEWTPCIRFAVGRAINERPNARQLRAARKRTAQNHRRALWCENQSIRHVQLPVRILKSTLHRAFTLEIYGGADF